MVARLRLLSALCALVAAVIVVCRPIRPDLRGSMRPTSR